jgi:hypothetical protein
MKKIFIFMLFANIIIINAQVPQGINYQSTVRNSVGDLLVNQSIGFKFTILLNSTTSSAVYAETQTVSSDDLGQMSCVIGQGTPLLGSFSSIDWANGNYYLRVEVNIGNGFVAMGSTQLMSVPYALYSNNSGASTNDFIHYIGELYGGGIVVSVWKTNGIEHGIIASLTNISLGLPWTIPTRQNTLIGTNSQNYREGLSNSNTILVQGGSALNYAAQMCRTYSAGGYTDWYLPAVYELRKCYKSAPIVNEILGDTNGFILLPYWSSTESQSSASWAIDFGFGDGFGGEYTKGDDLAVRAVRRF